MPSWEQFQIQHILDPAEHPSFTNWNGEKWNDWLHTRLGGNYGSKGINSVVIGTKDQVLHTFVNPTTGHNRGPDFYWSEGKFPIFVLQRRGSKYDVRKLPDMFFLALIHPDPNRPVHFHGQSTIKITTGQLPNSWNQYPLVP